MGYLQWALRRRHPPKSAGASSVRFSYRALPGARTTADRRHEPSGSGQQVPNATGHRAKLVLGKGRITVARHDGHSAVELPFEGITLDHLAAQGVPLPVGGQVNVQMRNAA